MKKILLPVLAAALLAGCAKEENAGNANELVPIRLGAGVEAVATKAPVNSGDQFTAGIAGWEAAQNAAAYTENPKWNTTITVDEAIDPENGSSSVTWAITQHYNNAADIYTHMKAWHPAGTLSGTTVTFEENNTDGADDVLYLTDAVSGNKESSTLTLPFEHKTTQLIFKVVQGEGFAAGTTINKIEVVDAATPKGINLATDALEYNNAANLTIQGIDATAGEAILAPDAITPANNIVGEPVMIKEGSELYINVLLKEGGDDKEFTNTKVTIDGGGMLKVGTAYTITLTVGREGIMAQATVKDWESATGSAELQ